MTGPALAWLGRGDGGLVDWNDLRAEAERAQQWHGVLPYRQLAQLIRIAFAVPGKLDCCDGVAAAGSCVEVSRRKKVGTRPAAGPYSAMCDSSTSFGRRTSPHNTIAGQDETSAHRHTRLKAGLSKRMVHPWPAPSGQSERHRYGRRRPCCRPGPPRQRQRSRLLSEWRCWFCSTLLSPSLSPRRNSNKWARGFVSALPIFKGRFSGN
jgi:hypothetical protein